MSKRQFLACVAGLLILSGCDQPKAKPDGVAIFVVDASGSCATLRDDFLAAFRKSLRQLGGTTVTVRLISTNNIKMPSIDFVVPRQGGPMSEYAEAYERGLSQVVAKAEADLRALLVEHDRILAESKSKRRPTSKALEDQSDILLVLNAVASTFRQDQNRDARHRSLYVLTDGLNQSKELDLMSPNLTRKHIPKSIAHLRETGLLPDLKGVTVKTVAGLGAGKSRQLTATKVRLVVAFWRQFFEATGASLNPDNIGQDISN